MGVIRALRVARTAIGRMRGYLRSSAFAGSYLADQPLLPIAPGGGGAFTTVKPSQHGVTAAAVIERFTGRRRTFVPQADGTHRVEVR